MLIDDVIKAMENMSHADEKALLPALSKRLGIDESITCTKCFGKAIAEKEPWQIEAFSWQVPGGYFGWDATTANEKFRTPGRETFSAPNLTEYILRQYDVSAEHVDCLKRKMDLGFTPYPGIMVNIHIPKVGKCDVLIDGSHRAALCHMIGQPFKFIVLNDAEEESIRICEPPSDWDDFLEKSNQIIMKRQSEMRGNG